MLLLPALIGPLAYGDAHILRGGDLIASLGEEAHFKVELPGFLAEHRILLHRRGATPLVALRAVASAMNASLLKVEGGYEVRRTTADLAAIRENRRKVRAEWVQKRIDRIALYRRTSRVAKGTNGLADALMRDSAAREEFSRGLRPGLPTTGPVQLLPAATLL